MSVKDVRIDKTEKIEELLEDYQAAILCGLPGIGRYTAVKMMLERRPDTQPVYCSLSEITDGSALLKKRRGKSVWYLAVSLEHTYTWEDNKEFLRFLKDMEPGDRIILFAGGMLPEPMLDLIWRGTMAAVLADTFWFTEEETWRFLKECGSRLRSREVYYVTGGWAACIAMLVRLERQLKGKWTVRDLCHRYEIRRYIKGKILNFLPKEELRILSERILFPFLNPELEKELWPDKKSAPEENLFVRGAMVYEPERECWHVQPALRMAVRAFVSADICSRAVQWYETHGYIQEALECCWYLSDRDIYRDCLIRNYDKVPFLHYENPLRAGEIGSSPELIYLDWMQSLFRVDRARLDMLRRQIYESSLLSSDGKEWKKKNEIFLNIAYTDPSVSTLEWMELLKEKTAPGHPVRLYFMLGESVSYLSGIRDLSGLFACAKEQREMYSRLWQERLEDENQMPFQLARLEYEFQTYGFTPVRSDHAPDESDPFRIFQECLSDMRWQIRIVALYLACLFANEEQFRDSLIDFIHKAEDSLICEKQDSCRWNTRALVYLAQARWGQKEKLMKWICETGGNISNEFGKTNFYMLAEIKINLYLGNFVYAEKLLKTLIPCFEETHSSRWLAEALFQKAVIEQEKGSPSAAVKTVAEAIAVAKPYRYVALFTGYGRRGEELLELYRSWMAQKDGSYHASHKKYQYGNVLRMSEADWIDYMIRKAKRQKKNFPDLREDRQNIYRVEKLTVTEQMVLHYLQDGLSNAEIGSQMNIRLSTVKSHIYNIYRKLGVSTRMKAVQKAKENGLL